MGLKESSSNGSQTFLVITRTCHKTRGKSQLNAEDNEELQFCNNLVHQVCAHTHTIILVLYMAKVDINSLKSTSKIPEQGSVIHRGFFCPPMLLDQYLSLQSLQPEETNLKLVKCTILNKNYWTMNETILQSIPKL